MCCLTARCHAVSPNTVKFWPLLRPTCWAPLLPGTVPLVSRPLPPDMWQRSPSCVSACPGVSTDNLRLSRGAEGEKVFAPEHTGGWSMAVGLLVSSSGSKTFPCSRQAYPPWAHCSGRMRRAGYMKEDSRGATREGRGVRLFGGKTIYLDSHVILWQRRLPPLSVNAMGWRGAFSRHEQAEYVGWSQIQY